MAFQRIVLAATCAMLGLAGCSASESGGAASQTGAPASTGCPISAKDTWAKAAESGSTAVFGELANTGSSQVTIKSAQSAAAGRVEIHEVVDKDGAMVMQPKPGGLAIEAGASASLAPGGDHIMLMELTGALKAGDSVTVTLRCSDGSTAELVAQVKTFTGAAEQYQPSASGQASPDSGSSMDPGMSMAPASPSAT
jgi:hypothetical protein